MSLTELQLAGRKIGSSDAYIACGGVDGRPEMFGRTRYDLWREITGRAARPDIGELDHVWDGVELEDFTARKYARNRGRIERREIKIRRSKRNLTSNDFPWMTCNIDRRVVGERRIVECKVLTPWSRGWGRGGTDEVPDYVFFQGFHQMIVTGWREVDVAALRGNEVVVYPLRWDQTVADGIIAREAEFWEYVERDEPPPPQTYGDLERRWHDHVPGSIRLSNAATETAAAELKRLGAEISRMEKERKLLKWLLGAYLEDAETLEDRDTGLPLLTWKTPAPTTRTNWQEIYNRLALRASANPTIENADELLAELLAEFTDERPNGRRMLPK